MNLTPTRPPVFVELCAGLAAVSLMLQGGRYARPPVSRMGNKAGYALAILRVMGLRPGQGADRFLWCEPDDGCRALLHAYTDREVMQEAARIIRSWADEEPRALWERLRAEGPVRVGEARETARGSVLGEWAFRQGVIGSGFNPNTAYDTPITDRHGNTGIMRGRTAPKIAALHNSTITLPATVTPDARTTDPILGAVMYADPPYANTTGYGHDLPRSGVVALARRWHDAGARVYVSEAEPIADLVGDGWHAVEITSQRVGQKRTFSKQQREWVTCSVEPAWRPAEQGSMF